MSHLPFTIKQKVLRHMYLQQLSSCWLLAGVKPKFMDALLAVARVETLMPRVGFEFEFESLSRGSLRGGSLRRGSLRRGCGVAELGWELWFGKAVPSWHRQHDMPAAVFLLAGLSI
jgi:hypothetical protein